MRVGGGALVTQVDVAFPGQSLEAREAALEQSVPVPPVPLQARLADLDDPTALPATTEEERGQRSAEGRAEAPLCDGSSAHSLQMMILQSSALPNTWKRFLSMFWVTPLGRLWM